jgi:uncharacterized membrane protein YdjX (TVP38/TMEM64 family)
MVRKGKVIIYLLWFLILISFLIGYILNPEIATPEYIVRTIQRFSNEMMLVYILLTIGRGFFLLPSTPFVIGGAILFPDSLFLVLVISMLGVMCSATALYYFSDLLGFSHYLEKKYPKGIEKWKARLQNPKAAFFVLGWAFFPLVPTDLICYVAGIVKMPFRYMAIGVFVGELVLNIFYVYFGLDLFEVVVL